MTLLVIHLTEAAKSTVLVIYQELRIDSVCLECFCCQNAEDGDPRSGAAASYCACTQSSGLSICMAIRARVSRAPGFYWTSGKEHDPMLFLEAANPLATVVLMTVVAG